MLVYHGLRQPGQAGAFLHPSMTASARPHPIDELIALRRRLAADAGRDLAMLLARDRAIGRELPVPRGQPLKQVRGWLYRVEGDALQAPGVGRAISTLSAMLALAGLLTGVGAARALLYYDGTQPVDLLPALAVLVLFQLVLLLALAVVALPVTVQTRLPGVAALSDLLMLLNPGRWAGALARRLPPGWRLEWDGGAVVDAAGADVRKWTMLSLSQVFAVAFNAAALVAMGYLLFTRDIAFGWSTTVNVETATLLRALEVLAAPWSWTELARPTLDLLEATRTYRPWSPPEDLASYGRWWPFLIAAVFVYGLLPRILLLLFARSRLRAAVREAMLDAPGVDRLLDRLNSELVETASPDRDPGARRSDLPQSPPSAAPRFDGRHAFVVDWAGAAAGDDVASLLRTRFDLVPDAVAPAGGRRSLDDDRALIRRIVALDATAVAVIVVKSWEPPTHEVADFIDALVAARPGGAVLVFPVAQDDAGRIVPAGAADAAVWQARFEGTHSGALAVDGGQP